MTPTPRLVEVCVFDAVKKPLTYRAPGALSLSEILGRRVIVPLGRRKMLGVVTALDADYTGPVRDIDSFPDLEPVLSAAELEFCRFIADYYLTALADVLQSYLPQPLSARLNQRVTIPSHAALTAAAAAGDPAAAALVKLLGSRKQLSAARLSELKPALRTSLRDAGLITLDWQVKRGRLDAEMLQVATTLQEIPPDLTSTVTRRLLEHLIAHGPTDLAALRRLTRTSAQQVFAAEAAGLLRITEMPPFFNPPAAPRDLNLVLNAEQTAAIATVTATISASAFAAFLLHGVTGSGKTEVYIECIKSAIAAGRRAIVIVPEIGLSQAIYYRLAAIFGDRLALIHSRMSAKSRFEVWQRARSGRLSIVLGPRSALFSPLPDLGLIIVDEEHDASLKQESPPPRYHARDLAVVRARQLNCAVILGSATPSVESYHNALAGKYRLLELTQRVDARPLPLVRRVDLRRSFEKRGHGYLSAELREQIEATLALNGQAMLLLNRRGFAPSVHCFACGHKLTCRDCDVALVYHKIRHGMLCHLCGYTEPYPDSCPRCRSNLFLYRGIGTEKMEEELRRAFPDVPLLRMDLDSTRKEGSFREIFEKFRSGQAKILLGTQMIAKGFDFPDVALVGIITADTSLELPDFRARERTFQLLTQASGRAGRHNFAGQVILQTLYPDDKTVLLAQEHDYKSFYESEIAERLELGFPPFVRLILVAVESTDAAHAQKNGKEISDALHGRLTGLARVHGPIAAPIHKRRSFFRFQILIKTKRIKTVLKLVAEVLNVPERQTNRQQRVIVDVDPVDMM